MTNQERIKKCLDLISQLNSLPTFQVSLNSGNSAPLPSVPVDDGSTTIHQHHILFYSPNRQLMTVKSSFKRPHLVYKQVHSSCVRCFFPSIVSIRYPKRKKSIEVHHSVCEKGCVEVLIVNRINSDLSYLYF